MLKKTITFEDFDGNSVTKDFYFHMSKAEIAKMELSKEGGFASYLKQLVAAGDGGEVIRIFEEVLRMTYGKRSDDGVRFIKSDELWLEFTQTNAYSDFFMELATDANAAADFIKNVLPQDLVDQVNAQNRVNEVPLPELEVGVKNPRDMTREELIQAFRDKLPGKA